MDKRKLSNMLLILTALIWGSAFVAQSIGMEYIGPFTFGAVRSILGGLTLLPVIFFRKKKSQANKGKAEPDEKKEKNEQRKTLLAGGICCGICLTIGSMAQQIGLQYTTAGKGGFITALYILIVPLLGLAFGRKAGKKVWCGVILAVVGMYFLCVKDGFSISKGDWIILAGSFAFAGHILVIDYFSPKVDGVCLSCLQFFICGMICAIPMLVSEQPTVNAVLVSWRPIVYAGVLSSGVGYTLQVIAQKNTDPTVASLLMSLESVFAVLAGWVILGERLSVREFVGCVLVFSAVILPSSRNGKQSVPEIGQFQNKLQGCRICP